MKTFGIKSVPTLVLVSKGVEQQRLVGSKEAEEVRKVLDKHLQGGR